MRKSLYFLILYLFLMQLPTMGQGHYSYFKYLPKVDSATPAWAAYMYQLSPNVPELDAMYKQYYEENPFQKTIHTQNYKHLRRCLRQGHLVDAMGNIKIPSLTEKDSLSRLWSVQWKKLQGRAATSNWQSIGPFETKVSNNGVIQTSWQQNVYCLDVANANPNVVYCGTETGGVFKTTDKGMNWVCVSNDLDLSAIDCIKVNPLNEKVVYIGEDAKIYKTVDGGISWKVVLNMVGLTPIDISINPADTAVVMVAASRLYRTTNGGESWATLSDRKVWDIEIKPNDPNIVYQLRDNPTQKLPEFWKSTDKGATWLKTGINWINPFANDTLNNYDGGGKLAVTVANPERVYAVLLGQYNDNAINDNNYLGILRSDNAGENWELPNAPLGGVYTNTHICPVSFGWATTEQPNATYAYEQGFYNLAIAASQTNADNLLVGFLNLFKSNDAAKSLIRWSEYGNISQKQHPDIQDIDIVGDDVWVCSDGGINLYTADFSSNEARNTGINASEFWGFGSGWNEDLLVGGRYHNGNTAWYETYPSGKYLALGGSESPTGYVFPAAGRKAFFSDIRGTVLPNVITGNVLNFNFNKYPNESYYTEDNGEVVFHPYCYNHIYLGSLHQLWKTTDGGASFELVYTFGADNTKTILGIEISRSNPNVMYVMQKNGNGFAAAVWKTTNGGASWTNLALPVSNISSAFISLSPTDENTLWLAFAQGGNNTNKIFKTTDGGSTWINLTTTTLNAHHIEYIIVQGGTNDGIYLATDKTIFYRNKDHNDWQFFGYGLPLRFNTLMLSPFYKTQKLRAATFNRGVWDVDFYEPSLPVAQPMADKLTVFCERDTVYFDDYSILAHEGATWSWSISPTPAYISSSTARNPKVILGGDGVYSVTLTIKDGLGNTDTKTITNMIIVKNLCKPDSIAGGAASIANGSNYVYTPAIPLATTNTLTLSAWIKPTGTQQSDAGIICSESGGACGLKFKQNNQLGYEWANTADSYNWAGAGTVAANEWSHVALVIYPDSAIVYLNGIPYKRNGNNLHSLVNFSKGFYIGNNKGLNNYTMNGLIDEVAIYDRALSRDEIRELRHLTRNQTSTDPHLKAYYQFNEGITAILDRAGNSHASFNGTANRVVSTAPVGAGTSDRLTVNNGGIKDFLNTKVKITFPASGIYPNGEIVVTKLAVAPDESAGSYAIPRNSYYIINNYGENTTFTTLTSLEISGLDLSSNLANNVNNIFLYKRPENADGNTWINSIQDVADMATFGTGTASIKFSTHNHITNFGQFQITTSVSLPINLEAFSAVGLDNQIVKIDWKVSKEHNLDYYLLERKGEITDFDSIYSIKVTQNTESYKTYTYNDETPYLGLNTYQLKCIDLDGSISTSFPEKVWINSIKPITVYPNIITNNQLLTIASLTNYPYSFTIYDDNGKTYYQNTFDKTVEIQLPKLSNGVYIYRINGTNYRGFGKIVITN